MPLVGGGYDWGLAWDFFKPLEFMYLFDGFFPENILCHGIHHHFAVTSLGDVASKKQIQEVCPSPIPAVS